MKRWDELSERKRKLLVAGGVLDVVMRTVALVDVARRPKDRIRGPKALWVVALSMMNSFGVVPTTYFIAGRKTDSAD